MRAANLHLHLCKIFLLCCLLSISFAAQGQSYLKAYTIRADFDSCKLGAELSILPSMVALSFNMARSQLLQDKELSLQQPNGFRPAGKFLRGRYAYWLAFRVENRSSELIPLGIEQLFIKKAWVEMDQTIQPLSRPIAQRQQNIAFNLAANQVYQYELPAGKTSIFYLLLEDNRLGLDLRPTLWNLNTFRIEQAHKLRNIAFGQTIFLSLFFTLAIISSIFYLSRRRLVFGWYMAFKWGLALYFLQEIIDYNATQSSQTPWIDWNLTKAGLMMAIFFTYLQFIHVFVKGRPGAGWIEQVQKRAKVFLISYYGLDLLLLSFGYFYLSWVLFYLFLWTVVLFSLRALWFLNRVHYPPAKYVFWAAFTLIAGFFISLLAFTFFEQLLSSIKGVELGFLPIGIGGILESVFFFLSLGEQEKSWLQEHLAFRERQTKALEQRHIHEHQMQVVLEQELNQVKRQLEAQEKKIVSNRELDSKNQRELAYKRLQLRTLRYGFLAKTSDDILQQLNLHLANEQVQTADEQLTRFGGFVRDLLFLAAEPSIAIQLELQLGKRLAQLNDFSIEFPDWPVQPQWRCPSLLFLSLLYHSAKLLPAQQQGTLIQEEGEHQISISFHSNDPHFDFPQTQPEIWMDAQEQLSNFNQGGDFQGALLANVGGWAVCIKKQL